MEAMEEDEDRRRGLADLGGGTRLRLRAEAGNLRLTSRLPAAFPPAACAAGALPGTMRRAARSRPQPRAGLEAAPAAAARRQPALTLERCSLRPPSTQAWGRSGLPRWH